jgi:hypothetical protein
VFRRHEQASDNALVPADFLGIVVLVKKRTPDLHQDAVCRPRGEATVDGRFRTIPAWEAAVLVSIEDGAGR